MNCAREPPKLLICPPYDFSSDDCPPPLKRSSEFDPHNPPEPRVKPDPRPLLPCPGTCCACKPPPLRKKPNVPTLKFRQLADCYNCRVSESCHNRKNVFYQRWQTYLDRLPVRYPNTDYKIYSCNDYVDLGINNDFVKYDNHLDLRPPPRMEALKNFLWMRNLAEANAEYKAPFYECPPQEPYCIYEPPKFIPSPALVNERAHRLRFEDGITRWRELVERPEYKKFVEGTTPFNSPIRPFRKDSSFTNPITTWTSFSNGNDPPFKEVRDLKMI